MPGELSLSRGDRRLLLGGAAVFVLMTVVALLLSGGATNREENPTTYSAGSGGAKATWLLLQALGYRIDRWELPPGDLRDPASTTLVLAEPSSLPKTEERDAIRRFLDGGGRVIATGAWAASFLDRTADVNPFPYSTWKRVTAAAPSAMTRAAPQITLTPLARWATGSAVPLYVDGDDTVVTHFSQGEGDALWLASAVPLTNAGLREPGNLEFLLAALGPAGARRVLWDEYFHGHRRRDDSRSAFASPAVWVLVQLGLFALAVLFTFSRRSGPILPPAAESRLSSLEFVRTLGVLYRRAGAASVAVDIGWQRFHYWLTRRLALPGNAAPEEIERAVRVRWPSVDESFGETLRACESARHRHDLTPRDALGLIRSLAGCAAAIELFGSPRRDRRSFPGSDTR